MSVRGKKNTKNQTAVDDDDTVSDLVSEEQNKKNKNMRNKNTKNQNTKEKTTDDDETDEYPDKKVPPLNNKVTPLNNKSKGNTKGEKNAQNKKIVGGSKTINKLNKLNNQTTNKIEKKDRYFKLIDDKTGKTYGRYTGDTPKQAASKGFTKMVQKSKVEGKKPPTKATIFLRESTRGSARKIYGYEAYRQKLPIPQHLTITNQENGTQKTITYHFRNKIKKIPVPDEIGNLKINRANKKTNGKKKTNGTQSKKTKKSNKKETPVKKTTKSSEPKKITKTVSKKSQKAQSSR